MGQPRPREAMQALFKWLGPDDVLVGYNCYQFDCHFIRELMDEPDRRVIDLMKFRERGVERDVKERFFAEGKKQCQVYHTHFGEEYTAHDTLDKSRALHGIANELLPLLKSCRFPAQYLK